MYNTIYDNLKNGALRRGGWMVAKCRRNAARRNLKDNRIKYWNAQALHYEKLWTKRFKSGGAI